LDDLAQARVLTETAFDLRGLGRLEEAISPARAGLNKHLKQERWAPAGDAAGNLSELLVTFGDLKQATIDAEQSIELAARAGDRHLVITNRATLADALHQSGEFEAALDHFKRAEALLNEIDRSLQYLHALRGYQFCDLLLDLNRYEEVLVRATVSLAVDQQRHVPHGIGLAYLAMARMYMMQTQSATTGAFSEASRFMTEAVRELKLAGHQDLLVRGLLANAELSLALESYDQAEAILAEAHATAVRGQMRLHQADSHLQYGKLHLARGRIALARKSLNEARQRIHSMGYHRRESALRKLEAML
jgi:tetratricopeptide (TPR) repeat protein